MSAGESMLVGGLVAVEVLFAMATFVVFARADFIVLLLARGGHMGSVGFDDELDEAEIHLLRSVVSRVRWVLLIALFGVGFGVGVVIMSVKLGIWTN